MSKKDIFVAILAGGKGERLWPKSRARLPKQYLKFFGKRTIIQDALGRARKIASKNILVITNKDSIPYIKKQLKTFERRKIIVEPLGRNTAPAVGLATLLAFRENKDSILVVMPSDHIISGDKKLFNAVNAAIDEAKRAEVIITLGIKPASNESTYGYIGIEKRPSQTYQKRSYKVLKFIEKPHHKLAKRLIATGRFFWNSGIFIFKSSTMLSTLKRHTPLLYGGLMALPEIKDRHRFGKKLKVLYNKVKSESLDYAILEETRNVRVVPSDFGWNDIGSFDAIARLAKRDRDGNAVIGSHVGVSTKDSFIFSDTNQLVATIGLKGIVVVATPEAVLVSTKKKAGEIRKLIKRIKEKKEFLRFL